MKIRNDFVSNSSSCSFTVSDVNRLVDIFKDIGQMSYNDNDNFEIAVDCSKADYPSLYYHFNERQPTSRYYDWDHYDNNSVAFNVSGGFNTFINVWNESNDDIKSKIMGFTITCDDYKDSQVALLKLMYTFCKLHNLDPKTNYSEISFDETINDNFTVKLISKIGHLKGNNKCQTTSKAK